MISHCSSCGSPIPDGQGSSCSMCYGDPAYGKDGYYAEWLNRMLAEQEEEQRAAEQRAAEEADDDSGILP